MPGPGSKEGTDPLADTLGPDPDAGGESADTDPLADTAARPMGGPSQAAEDDEPRLRAAVEAKLFPSDVEAPKIGRYAILSVLGEDGTGRLSEMKWEIRGRLG